MSALTLARFHMLPTPTTLQMFCRLQPSFEVEDRRHIKVYTYAPEEQAETTSKDAGRQLSVQVHIPKNSLFSLPHVELHKQGVFTTQELDKFAAVLKVANQLPQDNSQVCHVSKCYECCACWWLCTCRS